MKKKRANVVPEIPSKPTANITAAMRAEINETPEVFENAMLTAKQKDSPISPKDSGEDDVEKGYRVVDVTKENEVHSFEADVIGTFSQSSGTLSYDSIRSIGEGSMKMIKSAGQNVVRDEVKRECAELERLIKVALPTMETISDRALQDKIYSEGQPTESEEFVPRAPVWGQLETMLTKTCINEAVNNFFSSARDDIELTMRLARRDIYPRLHIELRTSTDTVRKGTNIVASRSKEHRLAAVIKEDGAEMPSKVDSQQSMEERSARMCSSAFSNASTARPPSGDYIASAYSYLLAFVKSVVPANEHEEVQ